VIDDAFDADIELFESRLRRLKRRGLVDMAILDYVQQCRDTSVKNMAKPQEVARVTARVKRLAVALDIPIVMLAQLNRQVDKEDRFPSVADIADSSSIEKDSDHVLIVHWTEDRPKEFVPYVHVAKNRRNAFGQTCGSPLISASAALRRRDDAQGVRHSAADPYLARSPWLLVLARVDGRKVDRQRHCQGEESDGRASRHRGHHPELWRPLPRHRGEDQDGEAQREAEGLGRPRA
jgi:hypothetical protein